MADDLVPFASMPLALEDVPRVDVSLTQAAAAVAVQWDAAQRLLAVHEASHAIAAAVLGIPLEAVTIKSRAGAHTETAEGNDTSPVLDTDTRMRNRMVMAFAGPMGEIEIIGEGSDGGRADYEAAGDVALLRVDSGLDPAGPILSIHSFGYGGTVPAFLANERARAAIVALTEAKARAADLVHEHREAILKFAVLLYRYRRLEGLALDEALTSAGVMPPPRQP